MPLTRRAWLAIQTTLGRFIASVLMVYGIVFTAMPLTIIGAEFVVARDNVNYAKKHLKHGPSWAVRHSEFTGVPESLTEGNKNAVYHIVSDQYMALSTYLGLMRKVFRAPRADRPQMEVGLVGKCGMAVACQSLICCRRRSVGGRASMLASMVREAGHVSRRPLLPGPARPQPSDGSRPHADADVRLWLVVAWCGSRNAC